MSNDPTRHLLRFSEANWRRIGELAARDGLERNALLLRAFEEYEERTRREPLPIVARANPLSTGQLILAYLLIHKSEEDARIAMRASVEEWREAIGCIKGLREEIDRKWSTPNHG